VTADCARVVSPSTPRRAQLIRAQPSVAAAAASSTESTSAMRASPPAAPR